MKNFVAFTFLAVGFFVALLLGGQEILSAREAQIDAWIQSSALKHQLYTVETMRAAHLNPNNNGANFSWGQNEGEGVRMLFVGDIMLSRAVGSIMQRTENFVFPFEKASSTLRSADITFGNLEGPISSRGKNQGSEYSFRADPRVVEGLVSAGFDVMSLANNHILDWGRDALMDTVSILTSNGVVGAGAGKNYDEANRPQTISSHGILVAFLAYTNLYPSSLWATQDAAGVSSFDKDRIVQRIKDIKEKKGADIVVVSLHWGTEYETSANQEQRDIAHALIDAGADIIVGHHPHVVEEVEQYHDGVIFYSLGNFVFDQNFSKETMKGLVGEVVVSQKRIRSVHTYNATLNASYQPDIILSP